MRVVSGPSQTIPTDPTDDAQAFFSPLCLETRCLSHQWYLAPFDHLLHDRNLWGIRRRSIVPAFALGLFFAFLPFPGHSLLAALSALALRVNLPVATLTTFVTNPITIGPMYFLCYRLGLALLGMEQRPLDFELSFRWLAEGFQATWQPLMLGCLLIGTVTALIGYVGLNVLWRVSIADYLARKRLRKPKDS